MTLTIQENQATLVVDSSEEISLTLSSYDEANKSYTFVTEDLEEVIVSIPSGYSDVLNV